MAAEAAGSRDPPLSLQDESAAQQLQDSVENPFLAAAAENTGQQRDNDGGEGGDFSAPTPPPAVVPLPAGRNQPPPPAYTEAFRRSVARGGARPAAIEVTPLLSRHSSVSTVTQQHEPSVGEHVRQQRGVARALLLWLGIGQWYSGLCIFFSFLFLSGGIVVITLSFLTLDKLHTVKLAVVAAGIVFVLLSLLWPCGWLWNQWNRTCGCSYAPFVAYTWALSLVYTATVGALIFGVNEHYNCIHYCRNCTFETSEYYPCEFVQMSMWTVLAMLALMAVVVFISFCYCCCNNCSYKKESQQNYNLL